MWRAVPIALLRDSPVTNRYAIKNLFSFAQSANQAKKYTQLTLWMLRLKDEVTEWDQDINVTLHCWFAVIFHCHIKLK